MRCSIYAALLLLSGLSEATQLCTSPTPADHTTGAPSKLTWSYFSLAQAGCSRQPLPRTACSRNRQLQKAGKCSTRPPAVLPASADRDVTT